MNSNTRIRVFVVVMFLVMGTLLYFAFTRMQEKITGLVHTVKENAEPNMDLVRIRDLWSGIRGASNNIRAYSVTRDQNYLVQFLELKDTLHSGIKNLTTSSIKSGRNIDLLVKIEES